MRQSGPGMIVGLIWLNHDLLMTTSAIALVVLSAAMHAGRNFLTKKAGDKQAFVWWYEIVGLLLFTPIFGAYVDPTALGSANGWLLITISGLLHFAYWVFLTKALENGDLSLVYPITRSSPALVLLFSMLVLNEDVSLGGVAGILLVATGSYCINMHELRFSALVRPILSLSTDRAIQFALLTLLSVTAYSIVDKVAVAEIHPVVFAYLYPWISMLLFSRYLGVRKKLAADKKRMAVQPQCDSDLRGAVHFRLFFDSGGFHCRSGELYCRAPSIEYCVCRAAWWIRSK